MLIVQIIVLVVLALGLAWLVERVPASGDRGVRDRSRRRGNRPGGLAPTLVAYEFAGEVHTELRPLLREIAAGRLARRQIALDRDPAAAREALGDELWELVRPGRGMPADRRAQGIDLAALERLTDRLEAL